MTKFFLKNLCVGYNSFSQASHEFFKQSSERYLDSRQNCQKSEMYSSYLFVIIRLMYVNPCFLPRIFSSVQHSPSYARDFSNFLEKSRAKPVKIYSTLTLTNFYLLVPRVIVEK